MPSCPTKRLKVSQVMRWVGNWLNAFILSFAFIIGISMTEYEAKSTPKIKKTEIQVAGNQGLARPAAGATRVVSR